jgi:hypothetical protein
MATLVIDRQTLPEALLPFIGADRIKVERRAAEVVLTPVMVDDADDGINPNDYDNDTDYLNAIPGMRESILEAANTPANERIPVPEEWLNAVLKRTPAE